MKTDEFQHKRPNAEAFLAVAATSGEMNSPNARLDDRSRAVGATMALEELDAEGSEFSWTTISSGTRALSPDASTTSSAASGCLQNGETAVVEDFTGSKPSTGTRPDHVSESSLQKHPMYFWDSIKFKVEGFVFQLPKYRFVEESEVLLAMAVDDTFDNPIELDVSPGDFESFLKAFLPRASAMCDKKPTLAKDEWIAVLKLSTQWRFNALRKLAISHLSPVKIDPIGRICLAKEYFVYEWLLDGYQQVFERLLTFEYAGPERPTPLSAQEAERIGLEVALKLIETVIRRLRWVAPKAPLRDVKGVEGGVDLVRKDERRFVTAAEGVDK